MNKSIIILLFAIISSSCAKRNLAYFSDLQEEVEYSERITNTVEPKIRPDDLLSITVVSMSPEANMLFNQGEIVPAGITASHSSGNSPSRITREGYLVDKDGYIDFPVLGVFHIAGLTKTEAKDKLKLKLEKVLRDPIVHIRYLNYKITVVGEVNHPSTFTIPSEKINILEALGMAGDMTAFGKRENVLVIREEEGMRKVVRLNLNSKDVLNSPYFFLLPNDVVYVEPHRIKQVQANTNTQFLAIAGSVISILIVAITRF